MKKNLKDFKNLKDNIKMVTGHFKIQLIDAKTNKVIKEHKETNKVMIHIYEMFSEAVYGYIQPNIDDFAIQAIALGTDGVDSEGIPKDIDPNRENLYSEENFWNYQIYPEQKAYVYQATFTLPTTYSLHKAYKIDEGATFPHYSGEPVAYRGTPYNSEDNEEAGVTIEREFSNNILKQSITLGKLAGNGHPMWDELPKYSEAALYCGESYKTEKGDKLGLIFSMKTFPEMPKSEECLIKIQWDLDFNIT